MEILLVTGDIYSLRTKINNFRIGIEKHTQAKTLHMHQVSLLLNHTGGFLSHQNYCYISQYPIVSCLKNWVFPFSHCSYLSKWTQGRSHNIQKYITGPPGHPTLPSFNGLWELDSISRHSNRIAYTRLFIRLRHLKILYQSNKLKGCLST